MKGSFVYVASALCWSLGLAVGANSASAQRVFDNQDPFFRRGNQIVEQEARRLSSDANPREVIINRPVTEINVETNGRVPNNGEIPLNNQSDPASNTPELVSPERNNGRS